jgi:hypothetical protein
MLEMGESLIIATQIAKKLLNFQNLEITDKVEDGYNVTVNTKNNILKKKNNYYSYMEDLIEHFLF